VVRGATDGAAHAITLAGKTDAQLTLLHVLELAVRPAASIPHLDMCHLREAATGDARRRLHALIPERARSYCTVATAAPLTVARSASCCGRPRKGRSI
jgi:hypothetical protein